jgi:putative ABC transport system permease protein
MPRSSGIRRLFRFSSSEARVSKDIDEEITLHLEERTLQLIAQGLEPAAARAIALREFGDVRQARAELEEIGRRRVRNLRRANWWSDLRQDLKYGVRSLRHAPLFSILAIVTLALGIGANAAVYGVLKSVLLDALPYSDPDRLVRVYARWLDGSMERGPMSAGTVVDLASRQRSFSRLAAFVDNVSEAVLGNESGSRITRLAWVEPGFFDTLGVTAAHGRLLTPEDATNGLAPLSAATLVPDTAPAVLATHGAWQRLFDGDPGLPGRTIRLNGVTRTIAGVLPRDFVGPLGNIDFYAAFDLGPVVARPTLARSAHWLGAIGRLRPGVTNESAQRELASIWTVLAAESPRDNKGFALASMPLREAMVGNMRTPLFVLMTSAALVLLIACANLTGALLARTLSRQKELAVRLALGAGRGRLIRQLLTESLLLALAGGGAGVLLAWLVLSTLEGMGRTALPAYADLKLDPGVVLATVILSVCAGMAFGIAPALSVNRSHPQEALRSEMRGASEGRRSYRLRGLLVAGQIALCVSLLAGAGLLARSLWAMTTAPLGFDPDHVLTATVQMPPRDYPTPAARIRFLEQFADRLRTLPGVEAVADVSLIPTAGGSRTGFFIDGVVQPPNEAPPFVLRTMISDDYFRALRIPLQQGRTFDARDRLGAAPTVVISQSMARRYWPDGNALGARIRLDADTRAPVMEVVGIVGDVRDDRARPDAEPMLYRSSRQSPWPFAAFVLRTGGDPMALLKPMELELAAIDRGLALQRAMSLRAAVREGLAGRQLPVLLMMSFGALALVLASVGVYAMFASIAAARAWEFGLRMALGSRPAEIAGLVLRQGAGWMVIGLAGGAVGVAFVVRLLRGLLYGVPPFDPIAIGIAVAILITCATIALLIPLRRATRVDPATALRSH